MVKGCANPANDALEILIENQHFITIFLCAGHADKAVFKTVTIKEEIQRWRK